MDLFRRAENHSGRTEPDTRHQQAEPANSPVIALAANSAWNILNFRMNLVNMLQSEGFLPIALVPPGEGEADLRRAGMLVHTIPMKPAETSPIADALLVARYYSALRRIGPVAFLGFTAKPNIYGSLAASRLGIPAINNLTGLGTSFIQGGILDALVSRLYRVALRRSHKIFFHNPDDLQLFVDKGLIDRSRAQIIPGSGVNLQTFKPAPLPGDATRVTFLFIGRLLWEKGVGEFVEAAALVKEAFPETRFQILGSTDTGRRAVSSRELKSWMSDGLVEYLGTCGDVRPIIEAADCVVLPSYREGMPRVLLEAAAMARPLLGTDVPGCRQLVNDGVTGFLCEARSGRSLADALLQLVRLEPGEREQMGLRARALVEERFSEEQVTEAYLSALKPIADGAR